MFGHGPESVARSVATNWLNDELTCLSRETCDRLIFLIRPDAIGYNYVSNSLTREQHRQHDGIETSNEPRFFTHQRLER